MSKPNLPPLPPMPPEIIVDESVDGDAIYGQDVAALRAWATAYAEEAVRQALAAPTQALKCIAGIENKMFGGDWDEIDEARSIANDALGALLLRNRDG